MRTGAGQGFSLIELLVVVGLLGLIASLATPALFRDDEAALDRAAAQVSSAFRFARSESVRTGLPHGVSASAASQYAKVYRLDESVNPPVAIFDIRDPVSKQLYDLKFGNNSDPSIASVYFKFEGLVTPQTDLSYAGTSGVPNYNDASTIRMLETGNIGLTHEGMTRTISVSPITSRVTVQ